MSVLRPRVLVATANALALTGSAAWSNSASGRPGPTKRPTDAPELLAQQPLARRQMLAGGAGVDGADRDFKQVALTSASARLPSDLQVGQCFQRPPLGLPWGPAGVG